MSQLRSCHFLQSLTHHLHAVDEQCERTQDLKKYHKILTCTHKCFVTWKYSLHFVCKFNKISAYSEIFGKDIASCNCIVTCRTREEDILRFLGASQRIKRTYAIGMERTSVKREILFDHVPLTENMISHWHYNPK